MEKEAVRLRELAEIEQLNKIPELFESCAKAAKQGKCSMSTTQTASQFWSRLYYDDLSRKTILRVIQEGFTLVQLPAKEHGQDVWHWQLKWNVLLG